MSWYIDRCHGNRSESGKELLIPAIEQCILDVDVEEPKVVVRLMKGMLE